jgi:hypothetical protein
MALFTKENFPTSVLIFLDRSSTVAISQTTEKRKDGRLFHLSASKKLPEFRCNLPQTACG